MIKETFGMDELIKLVVLIAVVGIAVAFLVRIYLLLLATQKYLEAKTEAQLHENRKRFE